MRSYGDTGQGIGLLRETLTVEVKVLNMLYFLMFVFIVFGVIFTIGWIIGRRNGTNSRKEVLCRDVMNVIPRNFYYTSGGTRIHTTNDGECINGFGARRHQITQRAFCAHCEADLEKAVAEIIEHRYRN